MIQGKTDVNHFEDAFPAKALVYDLKFLNQILKALAPNDPLVSDIRNSRITNWPGVASKLTEQLNEKWEGSAKKYALQYLPFALTPSSFKDQVNLSPLAATALKIATDLADTSDGCQAAMIVYDSDYLKADLIALFNSAYADKNISFATTIPKGRKLAKQTEDDVPLTDRTRRIILTSRKELVTELPKLTSNGFPSDAPIIFVNAIKDQFNVSKIEHKGERVIVHLGME